MSADDILQETWIAAFRHVGSFRANRPDAFDRWITVIAERKLIDACKGARRLKRGSTQRAAQPKPHQTTSWMDLFSYVASQERTPSRVMSAKEAQCAVQVALSSLPEDRRRAVWMRHIEGRSVAETAEAMKKTPAAVTSLVFNGLRQLGRQLGQAAKFFSDAPDDARGSSIAG